jgi:UDP-3-O-[3-hydroxymyristoyl] glucosamine N-acyltransferase
MSGFLASRLARECGGRLQGPDVELTGMSGLKEASPGHLSFLANPKYAGLLAQTRASCVIVPPSAAAEGRSLIVSDNPYLSFAKAVTFFYRLARPAPQPGIHPSAQVDGSARVDPSASVGAYAVIEAGARVGARSVVMPLSYLGAGTVVGEDCLIYPRVVIREECRVGNRVIIHCGAVVGSDGFGYAKDGDRYFKIPQVGSVILEDDVEIGANTAIDRGALGPTVIARGAKLDNLVQIAHNVKVGEDTAIAGQSGIAGSTEVGDRVVMAGQVGLVGHIKIGSDVTIGAQAGVTKSVPDKTVVSGYPAIPHGQAKRREAAVARLPEYIRKINDIERRIAGLEDKLKG